MSDNKQNSETRPGRLQSAQLPKWHFATGLYTSEFREVDGLTYLFLQSQHLETLEICKILSPILLFPLLCEAALLPLLIYLLFAPSSLDSASSSSPW